MSAALHPAPPPDLRRVLAVAREHAAAVDRDGRFPAETIAALREERLLAALVPQASGGLGQFLPDVAASCYALGRCCSSSAMVLAMHHIQVASLVNHPLGSVWLRRLLERTGREQLLLASVTSEAGVGGSLRTSRCAVEPAGPGRFRLAKDAPTISYGAEADVLLVTARAHSAADEGDQVLVAVPAAPGVLTHTAPWDAMGMRGTGSHGFTLAAEGGTDQILPTPFATISAETMVPVCHLLWASLWCGIASYAVRRGRRFLRAKLRPGASAPPEGASRLVRAVERLQGAEARVREGLAAYRGPPGEDASFAEAASVNTLKTGVADACLAAVEDVLLVCGFAGYRNDGPYSVARHLRDLHSARLMIHNDRIRDNTARLLLAQTPLLGLG